MHLTRLISAAATLSLIAAPALAGPGNRASALSLRGVPVRAGAPMKDVNRARGTVPIILGVTAAVVLVGVLAMSGKKDNTPSSP